MENNNVDEVQNNNQNSLDINNDINNSLETQIDKIKSRNKLSSSFTKSLNAQNNKIQTGSKLLNDFISKLEERNDSFSKGNKLASGFTKSLNAQSKKIKDMTNSANDLLKNFGVELTGNTAEVTENLNSASEAVAEINDNLSEQNENLNANNALATVQTDELKKQNNEIDKQNVKLKKQGGLLSKIQGLWGSAKSLVQDMSGITIDLTIASAVKDAWGLNNAMTALAAQMGKSKEGVIELEKSVTNSMKEIGTSFKNAGQIVTALAEVKYEGSIEGATKSIDMYSRATGVALSTTVQFTNSLNKQAGMSDKATTAILAGMVNVQQEVGISKNGMEELTYKIIDMSANMVAFGKTSDEIKEAAVKTTALVGAMEKVGVAASETLSIMDRLTDPERIEDNILLYSQLGISMQDALSGNIEVTDEMLSGLGEKVKSMGAIAGGAFARSMNLSYKTLTKMSNATGDLVEDIGEKAKVSEEEAFKKLNELMSKAEGLGKKAGNFFNKIKGNLMGFGPVLLTTIAGVALILRRRRIKAMKDVQTQATVMTDAVGESFFQKIKKSVDKSKKYMDTVAKNSKSQKEKGSTTVKDDLTKRNKIGFGKKFGESGRAILKDQNRASIERNTAAYEDAITKRNQYNDHTKEWIKYNRQAEQAETKIFSKYNIGDIKDKNGIRKFTMEDVKNYQKAERLTEKMKKDRAEMADKEKQIGELDKKIKNLNEGISKAHGGEKKALQKQSEELHSQRLLLIQKNEEIKKSINASEVEVKKANKIKKAIEGSTKESRKFKREITGLLSGVGSRTKAMFTGWKDNVIDSRIERGKSVEGFWGKAGVAKDMVAKPLGKALKVGGKITMVAMLIGRLLQRFLPGLAETFKPLVEQLGPMITNLLNTLVKSLLPPILDVLRYTLKFTMPIVQGISWLLEKLLGWIPGIGKAFKGLNETAKTLGGEEFLGTLEQVAKDVRDPAKSLTEAISQSNDLEAEKVNNENTADVINVSGGEAVISKGQYNNSQSVSESPVTDDRNLNIAKADLNTAKNFEIMHAMQKTLNESMEIQKAMVTVMTNTNNILNKNYNRPVMPPDVTSPGEI